MIEINQTYILISLVGGLFSSLLYYLYKSKYNKEEEKIKDYLLLFMIICMIIFFGLNINKYIESEKSILGSNIESKDIIYGNPNF
tara:strand:+ start:431 stop:685 length:255 start_codon:yes stop_codon:yes gene_type:complete